MTLLRRYLVITGVCVMGGMVSAATLKALPYSTSWITRVEPDAASKEPSATVEVGPLRWDLALYKATPSLSTFRHEFVECGDKKGLEAARCVSDILNAKSPKGDPKVEFVDAHFNPADSLKDHLGGAPGHCTVKSSLTAVALLSLGIPARVVQILPSETKGHNVVELWDPTVGWFLFDPHFDSAFLHKGELLSATKLSEVSGDLEWRRPHDGAPDPNEFAGSTILYPEPWLYTRVGEKCAPWPFRACFVQFGAPVFAIGPAQKLVFFSCASFSIAALLAAAWALFRWRTRGVAQ